MMIRPRTLLAGLMALTGLPLSGLAGGPVAGQEPMTRLAGSTVPFAAPGPARSLAASSSQLTVQVWLSQQEAAAVLGDEF